MTALIFRFGNWWVLPNWVVGGLGSEPSGVPCVSHYRYRKSTVTRIPLQIRCSFLPLPKRSFSAALACQALLGDQRIVVPSTLSLAALFRDHKDRRWNTAKAPA